MYGIHEDIFINSFLYRYVIDYYDGDLDPGSHRFVVMLLNCFSSYFVMERIRDVWMAVLVYTKIKFHTFFRKHCTVGTCLCLQIAIFGLVQLNLLWFESGSETGTRKKSSGPMLLCSN